MAQKLNNPQGSSPLNGNEQPVKKITPALLFSGLFVAISFIVMLIPLAVFNVSQVAAILGKRVAFYLMLAVSFGFILIGNIFGNLVLSFTGVFVIISIPFFMSAIFLREKKYHWSLAAFIHFIPAIIIVSSFLIVFNKASFNELRNNIQQQSQTIAATLDQSPALQNKMSGIENKNTEKADKDQQSKQMILNNTSTALIQMLDEYEQSPVIKEILSYSTWQKLGFLVYGSGSLSFFIVLLICFANVVFVDFGFEQIERLRAIVNYVKTNSATFSGQLLKSLLSLPMTRSNRLQTPILITQHTSIPNSQTNSEFNKSRLLSVIWKPLKSKNTIYWQGYSFKFEGKSPWGLREFAVPFPVSIVAIAILGGIGFWYGNLESILSLLQKNTFAPFIALVSVLSFMTIALVALQGMFTIYKRVPMLIGFVLMFAILYFSRLTNAPYSIIAFFGAVGLLDYVYDWRGKKA